MDKDRKELEQIIEKNFTYVAIDTNHTILAIRDIYDFYEDIEGFLSAKKADWQREERLVVNISERNGEPYIVIDDKSQGGKTIFAANIHNVVINNLTSETDSDE